MTFKDWSIGFVIGLFTFAPVAHAAILISPSSGADGLFTVQNDNGFSLYVPNDAEASSTYCTASSTPLTFDCNVAAGLVGRYVAVDASGTAASYIFGEASGTAAQLARATYGFTGSLLMGAVDLAFPLFAVLLVLFVLILIIWGFRRATARARPHSRRG